MQTNPPDLISYTEIARASDDEPTEFEDQEYFCLVYKGFFVPPKNGSYTLYIKSDDFARLYLSTNASTGQTELVAEALEYTTQKSIKITLQAGKAYYIEVLHCQGCCGWEIEFGAKYHDTNITSSQAYGEHEQQHIQVLSEIRKEAHVRIIVRSCVAFTY